jgi:ribosomal protein S18 acetylase RimI-like enzyme
VTSYELRPAGDGDMDFVYGIRQQTLAEYVRATWGTWDADDQRSRFEETWNPQQWEVIVVNGYDVGVLQVDRDGDPVCLWNVEIIPEAQGRGIGSVVIRDIVDKAHASGVPVVLQVLRTNTDARRLYERIGFVFAGETATHTVLIAAVPRPCRRV